MAGQREEQQQGESSLHGGWPMGLLRLQKSRDRVDELRGDTMEGTPGVEEEQEGV